MFRNLLTWLTSLQEKRIRRTQGGPRGLRRRLELEPLEDRSLPAVTLLWVAQADGGLWSNKANWAVKTTGEEPTVAPTTGDSLIFNPNLTTDQGNKTGTNFASTMNINGLSLDDLTLASGYTATITFNNDLTVTDDITIDNGKLEGNAAARKITAAGTDALFSWGGGTIDLNVELGTATVRPTMTISGTAEKTLETGTFTSYANTTWTGSGNIVFKDSAKFDNRAEATFDVQTDADITKPDGIPTFENRGTFKKTSGGGTTTVQATFVNLVSTSSVLLQSGTVEFTGTWRQNNGLTELNGGNFTTSVPFALLGGKLQGVGTITGAVSSDGGEVVPGLDGGSGTLNITGAYSMTATSKLTINITSTGTHGTLNVQGAATLAGTLRVNRHADYKPTDGTNVTFLTYAATSTGNFATFDIPNNLWSAGGVDNLHFTPCGETTSYFLNVNDDPLPPGGGNG